MWTYFQNQQPGVFRAGHGALRYLLRLVLVRGCQRVLNIGAGDGYFEHLALTRGLDVTSVDPDPQTVERLANLGIPARWGYAQAIPAGDGQFDAVVVAAVLEHLAADEMEQALAEVQRVLRPGGYLIGYVPYREDLQVSVVVCPQCGHRFHRWGHCQVFDRATLRAALASVEFEVELIATRVFAADGLNWRGSLMHSCRWLLWAVGVRVKCSLVFAVRREVN
jgi:SAM-dependent methyltransferase